MAAYEGVGQGLGVSKERLEEISKAAKDFALAHGISMRPLTDQESTDKVQYAAFTLFPSVIPGKTFEQMVNSMVDFNRLMHHVSHDHEFLQEALRNVIQVDDFTKGLWDIYTTVRKEGIVQPISFGMLRNDFMIDCKTDGSIQPKQIECNTIAAGAGGIIAPVTRLHRYTLDLIDKHHDKSQLPDNDPYLGMAKALVKAWELYNNSKAVILVVVKSGEVNVIDQRWLELKVHEVNKNVYVMRRSLYDTFHKGKLTSDKKLMVEDHEVAVAYFRSGYGPSCFPTQKEWEARLRIEQSIAIKCPSVQLQLAGTKKVQQQLTKSGSVEPFFDDLTVIDRIRATFVGIYSLDLDSSGDKAIEMALASPDKFVLKPQREGGGNNLYGEDITTFLKKNQHSSERNAYILMERIFPVPQKNYMIRSGVPFEPVDCVSEIGIFGAYIGTKEKEMLNTQCGHMVRTKTLGTNEGGIFHFSGLDTPYIPH